MSNSINTAYDLAYKIAETMNKLPHWKEFVFVADNVSMDVYFELMESDWQQAILSYDNGTVTVRRNRRYPLKYPVRLDVHSSDVF